MRHQIKVSTVSSTLVLYLFLCYIRISLLKTHTHQADVAHVVFITSSVNSLSWKHTWEYTKTELQPSLNSSICPSPPSFISFLLKHTHTQSRHSNVYQVCASAGCPLTNKSNAEQRSRDIKLLLTFLLSSFLPHSFLTICS